MKPAVAVTLIVMGTLLIIAPLICDQLHQAHLARIIEKGAEHEEFVSPIGTAYRVASYAAGVLMIAIAVIASIRASRGSRPD